MLGGGITPSAATLANDRSLLTADGGFAVDVPVLTCSLAPGINSPTYVCHSFYKPYYRQPW
jgi:hypothetical protein